MKRKFRVFGGSIAVAVLIMFTLSACDNPAGNNQNGNPRLPTSLQNTSWIHQNGDRVNFGASNTVTVIPVSDSQNTFTLRDSETVPALSRTTLWFGAAQLSDLIIIQDGVVSSVNLGGVQLAGLWNLYTGTGDNDVGFTGPPEGPITIDSATGIAFQRLGHGYAVVNRSDGSQLSGTLMIPATRNGLPVIAIWGWAFAGSSWAPGQLTNVSIPDSVTYIGVDAFGWNQLTSVTIGNRVTYIGSSAFRNNQLINVTIPNSVTSIGNQAFAGNQLISITIPDICTFTQNT